MVKRSNAELAELFFKFADILEVKGVEWKPRAYRRAARAIESLQVSVEKMYQTGGIEALKGLPGVGEGIAKKIEEFLNTGKVKEFEKESKGLSGIEELMQVRGLGPKKVSKLVKSLKIKNVRDLRKAVEQGKLKKVEGFGEKSEADVLRGLDILKEGSSRRLLGVILPVAREIQGSLSKISGVKSVVLAGSLRRMKETVGDIDILVASKNSKKVMDVFTSRDDVKEVIAKGPTKSSVVLKNNVQSDVRVLDEKSFGAGWMYFTGSKEHNVALRQLAIKKGLKLSEYGLFKNDKFVAGRSEKEVYNKLGLEWIPPELRENQGEIEVAKNRKLPDLVELSDIRGDLHLHSDWTDGLNSVEDMARTAKKLGYEYIAMTDHSKSERIANGMDEERLFAYFKELGRVEKKVGIKILKGSEVDILPDGSLDYSNDVLKKMDIVIAAVHSRFKSSSAEMTKRILRAFENPFVNVFVHPTGRLIGQRDPYQFDFEKVARVAASRNIALEVDSYPSRTDLKDVLVREAVGFGCKISISTDSHAVDHFRFMELGVAQARRGWVESKDIINAWSFSKLNKFLRK